MNTLSAIVLCITLTNHQLEAQEEKVYPADALAMALFALAPSQMPRLSNAPIMPASRLKSRHPSVQAKKRHWAWTSMNDEGNDEDDAPAASDDASGNETAAEAPQVPSYLQVLETAKANLAAGADIGEAFAPIEAKMKDLDEKMNMARISETRAALAKEQTLDKFMALAEKSTKDEQRFARDQEYKEKLTKQKMIESLFPVLDNFDRAVGAIKPQTDGEQSICNTYEKLIEDTVNIFKQMGVEVIGQEIEGTPFNYDLHEAITMVPTDQMPDETIMQLTQKGYAYEGNVLRAAQVVVARNEQEAAEQAAALQAEREAREREEAEAAAREQAEQEEASAAAEDGEEAEEEKKRPWHQQ